MMGESPDGRFPKASHSAWLSTQMDTLVDFLTWSWARHHNPLSWYIRPLFILPFCYFAYRKSVRGMLLTVVAVTSSMFWFPPPDVPDPRAVEFLKVERQWILGQFTSAQFVLTALIPIWFVTLAASVRRRMWATAAAVIMAGTALKIAWSFYMGGASAWIIVPPVALGNAVVAGVLFCAYWRTRHQSSGLRTGCPAP
jgi:hypothetical protein